MAKVHTLGWLILAFTAVIVSDRENTYYKLCSPFNALLILPESNWEAPVTQQRRFLVRLIEGFPNGTHISIRIVGDEEKKYEFVKDGQNFDDVGTINQLIVKSPNNIIRFKEVSNWISTSLDRNKSPKRAEKIFFIVNDQTKVDDVKKVLEVLKNKDRYVVLYGEHSIGDDWTYLALDAKNIHVLGKDVTEIEKTVQVVKTQSCLDDLKLESHADNQQKINYINQQKIYYISDIDVHPIVNTIFIVLFIAIYLLRKKIWPLHWRRSRDSRGVAESGQIPIGLKSDFMHLLRETQTIQSRWPWPEAREEIKNDPQFKAVNSEDQREQWFNEYIQDLLKSDFMHLLRETQTIQSRWTWPQAREEIKNDPRFQAVNSEDQREQCFNEYIQDLVEGVRIQENEDRRPIQAEENNQFQDEDVSLRRSLMDPQLDLNP